MAVVGYHRAPRSAGATWMRIVLALTLVIPAMALVAGPATAEVSVTQLADLDSGAGDSVMYSAPVKAGTKYFFAATVAGETELYWSTGAAGSATKIDVYVGGLSSYPDNLTPIPGTNAILFTAKNGGEIASNGQRLFISDGTTTAPVWPAGFGAGETTRGFYFVEGLTATATKGVAFTAFFDLSFGVYGDYLPYRLTATDASTYSAFSLVYGFSYSSGNMALGGGNGLFGVIGDVVYSELLPTGGDQELWKLDLNAGSPTWTELELSPDPEGGVHITQFSAYGSNPLLGVAGTYLYFSATPYGGSQAVYATNGGAPSPVWTGAWDDYYAGSAVEGSSMYWVNASDGTLWRSTSGGSADTALYDCADNGDIGEIEALGTRVFLSCNGTLYAYDSSASSTGTISGTTARDPFELTAFEGAVYFAAMDGSPTPAGSPELYSWTPGGGAAAKVQQINGSGSSDVRDLTAAGKRLFFWATDGSTGFEPYIASPVTYTLTIQGGGTGSGTVTADGIDCHITAGTADSGGGAHTDCSESVVGSVTLTAAGDTNFALLSWSGTPSLTCTEGDNVSNTCTFTVSAARSVTATFATARALVVSATGTGQIDVGTQVVACTSVGGDCNGTFANGRSITLTTGNLSGRSVSWVSGCTPASPGDTTCTFTISGDTTVVVRFGYSLTLTVVDAGGTGSDVDSTPTGISNCTLSGGTCTAVFAEPGNVTLTATPVGATVAWSNVDCTGIGESATSNTCTFAMASPAPTPTVTFTASGGGGGDTLNLTVVKDGTGTGSVTSNVGLRCGGTCSTATLGGFANPTSVTLTAKPAKGSAFRGWSGATCSGIGEDAFSLTCTFSLTADKTVTANFETLYTLTVTKVGLGGVVSTSSPPQSNQIACGTKCSTQFAVDDVVELTATAPGTGSWTWSGCDEGSGAAGDTCTVTVDGVEAVTLTFTAVGGEIYTNVSVSAGRGGTVTSAPSGISCPGTCSWVFRIDADADADIVLTANPAAGYSTATWTGCPNASGLTCTIARSDTALVSYTVKVRFSR